MFKIISFMKINTGLFGNLAVAVTMGVILSSCMGSLSYQEALNKNRKQIDDVKLLEDAQFLVDAQSLNLLETKMNKLASERGYSAEVVNFAKKSVEHNEDILKDLRKLSRKEKIKIPDKMKSEHADLYEELNSVSRADFDQEYVETLEKVNEDNRDLYNDQSTSAYDNDIRAFAARRLGMYKAQEEQLSDVGDELLQTHK